MKTGELNRLLAVTQPHLVFWSPCTPVSRRKTFPSSVKETLFQAFSFCSALNNHHILYSWGCNLCNSQYLLGLWRLSLPGEEKGEGFSCSEARRSKLLSRVFLEGTMFSQPARQCCEKRLECFTLFYLLWPINFCTRKFK